MNYFPCTVVVASFTPKASASVVIQGASWWFYAGKEDWDSSASLLVSSGPFGLRELNMSKDTLSFYFSEYKNIPIGSSEAMSHQKVKSCNDESREPVTPTSFTFNLHINSGGTNSLDVALVGDDSVIGAFTFNQDTWYTLTAASKKIPWPN